MFAGGITDKLGAPATLVAGGALGVLFATGFWAVGRTKGDQATAIDAADGD
jgi:hypothetical protein